MKKITTPLTEDQIKGLVAGQELALSGQILTARDQAHKRLIAAVHSGRQLPVPLAGQVVYYCGPTATPPHNVIGSCGPTTSRRMDAYSPQLMQAGLRGMIGKGDRSPAVYSAIRKFRGVYFVTFAGCGALMSTYVRSAKLLAYADLGPEAVQLLAVEDMPLIVAIDSSGRSIYKRG